MVVIDLPIRKAFPLISQLIQDAFKTDCYLFTYPYEDFSKIDRGFRKMIWDEYPKPQLTLATISGFADSYHIFVIKSTLGFYNVIASVSIGEHPDFITIGPFRDEELSPAFFGRIIRDNNITSDFLDILQQFYKVLPMADVQDLLNLFRHLLTAFLPEFSNIIPKHINFSEAKHAIIPNEADIEKYSYQNAEFYGKYLTGFLDALASGNVLLVSQELKRFLDISGIAVETSLSKLRRNLLSFNAQCLGKLLSSSIHPLYILRLFYSNEAQIITSTDMKYLAHFVSEMARKYCLLAKNYAYPDYSFLTRSVMNYVTLHLDEELSLSTIAKYFDRNPSALSGQFSKETGQSLTDYIHSERINAAIKYFNTTDLTVSEVATNVGITDFGYFSKLFKKKVGLSPRSYKRMLSSK